MTEAEWLRSDDPRAMLGRVGGSASDRQLRHLMVAPIAWSLRMLGSKHSRYQAEILERYAAGQVNRAEFTRLWADGRKRHDVFETFGFPWGDYPSRPLLDDTTESLLWFLRRFLREDIILHGDEATWQAARESRPGSPTHNALTLIANDLRDIFGNPFHPVTFADSWRSETAVALATGIYAERAFDRMPILADALEEAGCDYTDVLSHCRGPGPHVRGCWVVDGVLGKS